MASALTSLRRRISNLTACLAVFVLIGCTSPEEKLPRDEGMSDNTETSSGPQGTKPTQQRQESQLDDFLRSRRSTRSYDAQGPMAHIAARRKKISDEIVKLRSEIAGYSDRESVASALVEELIRGRLDLDRIDWSQVQVSLGLPAEVAWAKEAAHRYLEMLSNRAREQGAQVVPYLMTIGRRIEAKVRMRPSDLPPQDILEPDGTFWIYMKQDSQGTIRVSGFSSDVFGAVGELPESKYAVLAAFRRLRLAVLGHDKVAFSKVLSPRIRKISSLIQDGHSNSDVELQRLAENEKLRVLMSAFDGAGYGDLLSNGNVVSLDRDRDVAFFTVTHEAAVGVLDFRLLDGQWYLSDVRLPIALAEAVRSTPK